MTKRPPGEPQRKRIEGEVRRFILDRGLLPQDGRLLLAVSGGPDSTALLLIVARLAKNLRLSLGVAHFDHGLRGEEAAKREGAFVRGLACALDLPLFAGSGDVRALARSQHLSQEDAARRARYSFLSEIAACNGYSAVATGHTASDQAETVLLHLVRGAGLDGLAGMAPRASWPLGDSDLALLRPVLALSREQTMAYCTAAGASPLEDETNVSLRFRRNRVRLEVLPLLRELNPAIDAALVRLADAAAEDVAYLRAIAAAALVPKDGGARLSLRLLKEWPASPRRHALRAAYALVAGGAQELGQRHAQALERLVLEGRTGDRLSLPREVSAVLRRDALELRPVVPETRRPDEPASLSVPGEAQFGRRLVAASTTPPATGQWTEVDAAAAGPELGVRRRRPGDRFQPLGMTQEKKLQDFLTDAKIPRDARDAIPLFVSPRGIVWVGGLRVAEWAKPQPGRPTVCLSYRPA